MFNNYYFLTQLSSALKEKLVGMKLGTCFSQSKDELMIGFYKGGREQWIRASLIPNFNLLTFPLDYQRKKVNSIDLFKEAVEEDLEVEDIIQYHNERAFLIKMTNQWGILFKMYGNRSNILLIQNDEVHSIFQKRHIEDQNMEVTSLDRSLDQSKEGFLENGLQKTFPTLGREAQSFLKTKGWELSSAEEQWNLLTPLLEELKASTFYISEQEEEVHFLLFKDGNILYEGNDPIEAANEFYYRFSKRYFVERERGPLLKEIDKRLKQSKAYLKKNYARFEELTETARFEEIANIIMANLHAIPPRTKKAKLYDFYKDEEITIKLNEFVTPQKNAETYYRKAKNQKLEVKNLEANIEMKEKEMEEYQKHKDALIELGMVREIRKYIKTNQLQKLQKNEPIFPFRKFEYKGFEIWVGKNAVNNDLLTQRYAHKRDLWLHARDVAGSHVVVKWKSKQPNFPVDVIEKAASIAAYYSQRKTDTLCPVIYTPKKFVRKRKGDPAGLVVVDKEKVVLIEPAPFSESLG